MDRLSGRPERIFVPFRNGSQQNSYLGLDAVVHCFVVQPQPNSNC